MRNIYKNFIVVAVTIVLTICGTFLFINNRNQLSVGSYNPPNANGQATMANSSPVVIASDQSAVAVTGTLTAVTTLTGTTTLTPGTAAANLGKAEDAVHASGDTGVLALGVANVAQTTLAANGDYIGRSADLAGNTMVVGNIASAGTDAGNPVKIGGKYNSTLPTFTDGQRGDLQIGTRGSVGVTLFGANSATAVSTAASGSDAASNTANALNVWNYSRIFNSSTWDRQVSIINATNSTGTGIAAAGILGQVDDTSPTAITENSFGNIRMSSDHSILVTNRATTPTQTSVAGSATSVSLLAANASRKGATVYNDSSAILYLKLGATASTTSYTLQMAANGYYEVPFGYVGAIDGIWASATGNARITELN